jgi:DnaJ family protein A protein 2
MKSHESFERSGNDLLINVKITLSEALLGFSRILVTHLDGRGVKVTSPPGKIIKPGDSIVLRNEGMPVYKHPDQRGHLYVIMDVEMPDEDWLRNVDRAVRGFSMFHISNTIQHFLRPSGSRTVDSPPKSRH